VEGWRHARADNGLIGHKVAVPAGVSRLNHMALTTSVCLM
jgi:hypothetical protein